MSSQGAARRAALRALIVFGVCVLLVVMRWPRLSLREMLFLVAIVGQGAVIIYQQHTLNSLRATSIPATIRVREGSYVHPNGPASE